MRNSAVFSSDFCWWMFFFTSRDDEISRNCCDCKVLDSWDNVKPSRMTYALLMCCLFKQIGYIYRQRNNLSVIEHWTLRNCKSRLQWQWPGADTSDDFRDSRGKRVWCIGTKCTRCFFGAVPCEWRRWKHWTDVWCSLPIYLHSPSPPPALLTLKEC